MDDWTKSNKIIAKTMYKRAWALGWIYEHSSGELDTINTTYTLIITMGLYLLGVSGLVTITPLLISLINTTDEVLIVINNVVALISTGLSLILGGIQTYHLFKSPGKKSAEYSYVSRMYYEESSTSRMVITHKDTRPEFEDFFSTYHKRDLTLREGAKPPLEISIVAYMNQHGANAVPREILFGSVVNMEELDNDVNNMSYRKIKKRAIAVEEDFELQRWRNQ